MLQYTNGFSCAFNADSGELIIKFVQQAPIIRGDGITSDTNINEIAEIIMPKNVAKQFSDALNNMLNSESEG